MSLLRRSRRLRRRLRIRYPITADRVLGAGELPNVRLQRALSRPGRVTALDRVLSIVHWVWFFEPHLSLLFVQARHVDRPTRRAADGRHLRPGLRDLLRGAHRTAVVGLRAGLHETAGRADPGGRGRRRRRAGSGRGPADHGRCRGGRLGPRLGPDVRPRGRQPVGRDAVAPLRDLADGRAAARRDRPDSARSASAMPPRSRSPSSTWGSTTSPTCSPAPRSSPWCAAASRSPSPPSPRSTGPAAAGADRGRLAGAGRAGPMPPGHLPG